jgi:hypothetical protein
MVSVEHTTQQGITLKFEVFQFGNDTMLEYRNKKQKT